MPDSFWYFSPCERLHSATFTCSTHPVRSWKPSLSWAWSSYATCTCSAWETCGSSSSTFLSLFSPPSSSTLANSKTGAMTVVSEEHRSSVQGRTSGNQRCNANFFIIIVFLITKAAATTRLRWIFCHRGNVRVHSFLLTLNACTFFLNCSQDRKENAVVSRLVKMIFKLGNHKFAVRWKFFVLFFVRIADQRFSHRGSLSTVSTTPDYYYYYVFNHVSFCSHSASKLSQTSDYICIISLQHDI